MFAKRAIGWTCAASCWLACSCAWAGPAEDQFNVAAGHYSAARWRLACEEFDAFLTQFPTHPQAERVRFYSAEALMQQGRYDEACRRYADFLKNQPAHDLAPKARFSLGEATYFLGETDAAQAALEEFRRRDPRHPLHQNALAYLGDLALRRDDAAQAAAHFSQALALRPEATDAESLRLRHTCRFGLARAREALGDTADAERLYREVAAPPHGEFADDAHLYLGLLYHRQRRYEQATQVFRSLEAAFPQSEHVLHAQFWLAKSQFALQNWEGAAATLAQVRVAPDHALAPAVAFTAGETLARLRRLDEAKRRFGEVVQQWPDSEWADDALQAKIDLALAAGDWEAIDALASDFQNRFAHSEHLPAVRLAQGRSLLRREKFSEAATLFEALLQPSRNTPHDGAAQRRENVYRYYLGLARLGANEFQPALAALDPIPLDGDQPELADGVRVARAAALVGLERFDEAVPLLRAYLQAQPHGPDAAKCRVQLVAALTRLHRLPEAATAHDELMQRHPDHAQLLSVTEFLAETAYAAGENDLARRMFSILAREGNPPQVIAKGLSGLAWLEFEGTDAAGSTAAFERLLREHPDSRLAAEAAFMQAKAQERVGQFDAAAALYAFVLEKHAASDQAPTALLALARLRDRQGQDAEAATLYQRWVANHATAPDLDAALYQWAWALADANQGEAANAVFMRLADEHPQSVYSADAAYRLAERALEAKDYPTARQRVEQSLRSAPAGDVLAHALYLQGQIAAEEERWSDASAPLERLLAEFPQSPLKLGAMYWTAESYYRRHQFAEAGRRLAQLAPLVEHTQEPWAAMVALRQAQVLAHEKRWQEADERAAEIARRWPDFRQQYEADYLIGRCRMAQAKFGDAREAFERVVRSPTGGRTETAAMAQWMTGETYFHQKNYTEAIKAYHRVERLFPYPRWQAGALLQSGKCHEMQGAFADAVKLYAQVLNDYADSPFAEEASQRLRVAQKRTALTSPPGGQLLRE